MSTRCNLCGNEDDGTGCGRKGCPNASNFDGKTWENPKPIPTKKITHDKKVEKKTEKERKWEEYEKHGEQIDKGENPNPEKKPKFPFRIPRK